jgi:sec-independent protein translocase protein TatC
MSTKDDIEDSSAPLVEHLIELRNRLIWAVSAFFVAMILCFVVAEPILDFMLGRSNGRCATWATRTR